MECPTPEEAGDMYMIFKELLDTNKDGTVEYDEAMAAVEAYCTGEGKGTCEGEEFEKDFD